MRVVYERPPNFAEINDKFDIAGKSVIFAWADVIFNPMRVDISPALMVHEEMHASRQRRHGPEMWWRSYIDSDRFRLEEEILAHQVEYRERLRGAVNRSERRHILSTLAKRMAMPMYGKMITRAAAKKVLIEARL